MAKLHVGERRDCRACGKTIVGARTMAGGVAPIETDVSPAGNVLLQRDSEGALIAITTGGKLQELLHEAGAQMRLNHFASCPQADRFRPAPAETANDVR